MFANERQDKIYAMIQKNGAVTTSGLMEAFGVSVETIRRDLLHMEQQGRLVRVHGGAVTKGDMMPFPELKQRNELRSVQKQNLACRAAELVCEGDVIGIDSGSTAISFAEAIRKRFTRLTVITHSLDVFHLLCDCFTVILCGGQYMRQENTLYGPLTLETLKNLHMQKAFIFPSAVSLKYGICDFQHDIYLIQKQMLQSSDEIYILADSSKYEQRALLKLEDMKQEYYYVTDGDLADEIRKLYKENNIKIYAGGKQK